MRRRSRSVARVRRAWSRSAGFCEEQGVDAWFRPDGDLGAASSEAQIGYWAGNVMAAERLGMPDLFRLVDRESVRELIDTPRLHGGIYTAMGATVQPARLARGVRRALLQRGVRIYEQTPVTRFGAGAPAVAETPGGSVRAGAAVVALNAWAARWKRFRRLLTVRGSYIALTAPAPDKLEELHWTNGMGLWDHRAALHYVRTTPDGRIAFGVGGMQPGLARSIGPRFAWDERAVRIAAEDLYRMFPSFADVPIDAAWGGPIDVAGHHLPFFGSLERGNVHYGLRLHGQRRGALPSGGQLLATMALGRHERPPRLPLVTERPMRFPPEPIRSPGATSRIRRSGGRTSSRTRGRNRVRSSTSSRTCRAAWGTTWAHEPRRDRRRARARAPARARARARARTACARARARARARGWWLVVVVVVVGGWWLVAWWLVVGGWWRSGGWWLVMVAWWRRGWWLVASLVGVAWLVSWCGWWLVVGWCVVVVVVVSRSWWLVGVVGGRE